MSNLSIRKKSINTWLHTDSVFGDFIISKFYFNSFFAKFQIVEEGNTRLEKYEIANITLYDDTDGGVAETFTNITQLSLRLEELQYPAFDRVGTSVFPSMEQITNVNVTDVENGQVLAWDVATSKWVNITIGSSTTPNLQQVTDEGNITNTPFGYDDGGGNETTIQGGGINISTNESVGNYLSEKIQFLQGFATEILPPSTPIANVAFEHPAKAEGSYTYATVDDIPILNENFLGTYTTLLALQTAHTTASSGNYAIVDGGIGIDAVTYIWDDDDNDWVAGSSSSISSTDALPEGTTNLYFLASRVLSSVLSGISFATGTDITSADTVLSAFGKLQKQISDLISAKQDKPQILNLTSDYTLTSSTSAQKLFNVGTGGNGAFDATASTIYEFELFVDLSTLSSTSGFFSFSLTGTATYNNLRLKTSSTKTALISGSVFDGVITSASAYQLTIASIATVGTMTIKGLINVNVAGTVIPTITLSQASAGVVLTNSYCKLTKI